MMWYCQDCGLSMDDVEVMTFYPVSHPELDGNPIEWIGQRQCIYCGSPNVEEGTGAEDDE